MRKYISLLIGLLLVIACKDTREDNLTPAKVYIPNSFSNVRMFSTGVPHEYRVAIYKSGFFETNANVTTELGTNTDLEEYNSKNGTKLVLLPNDCFEVINNSVQINSDARNGYINLKFDPNKIAGLEAKTYALPIKIKEADVDINKEKAMAILVPKVEEPYIYLKNSGYYVIAVESEITKISLPVLVDFLNLWDIVCDIKVNEQLLIDYNKDNATNLKLIDMSALSLGLTTTIKNHTNEAGFNMEFSKSKLGYGVYGLPLELSSVSKFTIEPTKNTVVCGVFVLAKAFDRSKWTIVDFSSEEPGEGSTSKGTAVAMLDGDVKTFWHSGWANGASPLPHHVTVDMQKNVRVEQIELITRLNNGDTKAGEFYISSDNINWTKIGSFELIKTNNSQYFTVTPSEGRYFKIVITQSNRAPFASLAELIVRGADL